MQTGIPDLEGYIEYPDDYEETDNDDDGGRDEPNLSDDGDIHGDDFGDNSHAVLDELLDYSDDDELLEAAEGSSRSMRLNWSVPSPLLPVVPFLVVLPSRMRRRRHWLSRVAWSFNCLPASSFTIAYCWGFGEEETRKQQQQLLEEEDERERREKEKQIAKQNKKKKNRGKRCCCCTSA